VNKVGNPAPMSKLLRKDRNFNDVHDLLQICWCFTTFCESESFCLNNAVPREACRLFMRIGSNLFLFERLCENEALVVTGALFTRVA
jgi:hypothetical protein